MTWELTEELENKIVSWLEDGKGLVKFCLQDGVPSRNTILRWQSDNADFGAKCVRAREAAGELAAEELDDINALVMSGVLDPSAAKVISSNKQWKASKLASKTYGDKSSIDHSGGIRQDIHIHTAIKYAPNEKPALQSGVGIVIEGDKIRE